MTSISQNAIKSGFSVISGRNSGEIEGEFHYYLKKQSVRQGKLVQFSRYKSCPAKVSRPAGMITCVSGGNK
jgi:hypothetical protein